MSASICDDVKEITQEVVNHYGIRMHSMHSSTMFNRFYESLLTFRSNPETFAIESTFLEALVRLRYVEGQNRRADELERIYDSFLNADLDSDLRRAVICFLCHLYLLKPNLRIATSTGLMQSARLKLSSLPLQIPESKIIKNARRLIPTVCSLPKLLETCDFPTLPQNLIPKDADEGFEDSNEIVEERNKFNSTALHTVTVSPKDGTIKCLLRNNKLKEEDAIYVTNLDPFAFLNFYLTNYVSPVDLLLGEDGKMRSLDVHVVSIEYLTKNVVYLLLGAPGKIFCMDSEEEDRFTLRPRVCIFGYTIETSNTLLTEIMELAKNVAWIERILRLSFNHKSNVSRMFGLLTYEKFVKLKSSFITDFESLTNNSGFLSAYSHLTPFVGIVSLIKNFLTKLDALNKDGWEAAVILDNLYDTCSFLRICSLTTEFFFSDIFGALLNLYFRYVEVWITNGECSHNHMDFFVTANVFYCDCEDRNFWTEGFMLDMKRAPKFLIPCVDQILMAGKTAHLMHRLNYNQILLEACANSFISEPCFTGKAVFHFGVPSIDRSRSDSSESERPALLANFIDRLQITLKSSPLLDTRHFLMHECRLESLFRSLREIYLGANGFFTSSLANNLFPVFQNVLEQNVPSDSFYPAIFNNFLDEAIDYASINVSVFLKSTVSFVFEHSVNESSTIQRSIDSFRINCDIPWPCNIIITASALQCLSRVFNFLLTLRWATWSIDDAWNYLAYSERDGFLKKHQLILHQREMKHFLQQLEVYVLHQTVDVCWSTFNPSLACCQNVDEIFEAHSKYINDVVVRCLLTPKALPVFKCIKKLLDCAMNFRRLVIEQNNEEKAVEAYKSFNARSKALITVVEKLASRVYQPHLSELLTRLNFNHFYF